jgi:hypothetical protein
MKGKLTYIILIVMLIPFTAFGQGGSGDFNRTTLPIPDQPFQGKTGLRPADSEKDFPRDVRPRRAHRIFC